MKKQYAIVQFSPMGIVEGEIKVLMSNPNQESLIWDTFEEAEGFLNELFSGCNEAFHMVQFGIVPMYSKRAIISAN